MSPIEPCKTKSSLRPNSDVDQPIRQIRPALTTAAALRPATCCAHRNSPRPCGRANAGKTVLGALAACCQAHREAVSDCRSVILSIDNTLSLCGDGIGVRDCAGNDQRDGWVVSAAAFERHQGTRRLADLASLMQPTLPVVDSHGISRALVCHATTRRARTFFFSASGLRPFKTLASQTTSAHHPSSSRSAVKSCGVSAVTET